MIDTFKIICKCVLVAFVAGLALACVFGVPVFVVVSAAGLAMDAFWGHGV